MALIWKFTLQSPRVCMDRKQVLHRSYWVLGFTVELTFTLMVSVAYACFWRNDFSVSLQWCSASSPSSRPLSMMLWRCTMDRLSTPVFWVPSQGRTQVSKPPREALPWILKYISVWWMLKRLHLDWTENREGRIIDLFNKISHIQR